MSKKNKPHVHAEQIKAWADGAEIQYRTSTAWVDVNTPRWYVSGEYRIKPRTFKKGAIYPVLRNNSDKKGVACYSGDGQWVYNFDYSYRMATERFSFIGEELPLSLWGDDDA